ncbi:MAG: chemotaxis protein CheX [Desulfobacterium sp.]|nr:chemotaxis protein CheX [Desulfobacterium sp.]
MMTSISEVMETMFFLPLEEKEGSNVEEVLGSGSLHACTISFTGAFTGTMALVAQEPLLLAMTENFMGETRESLGQTDLEETLQEALNMIAGNCFSKVDPDSVVDLGVPQIENTLDHTLFQGHLVVVTTEGMLAALSTLTGTSRNPKGS